MTWAYVPVLNECIKLLLTIVIGAILGASDLFQAKTFVPQAIKFVFSIALPLHILGGIGIGVNFYSDSFLWIYILGFLVLRVIALCFSILWVISDKCLCKGKHVEHDSHETRVGKVAVIWLALTWISTVVLGIPIMSATFSDAKKGIYYGLLAGISSFIFQLPLQMFLFECHFWQVEQTGERMERDRVEEGLPVQMIVMEEDSREGQSSRSECIRGEIPVGLTFGAPESAPGERIGPHAKSERTLRTFALRRDVWCKIWCKMLQNPVVWGIIAGFVLSLTTVGPRFLNATSPEFVPGLGWIQTLLAWFGECVSPVTLFAMGVWMQHEQSSGQVSLFNCNVFRIAAFMISKVFVVPLLMLGLARAFKINDEAGRAAVLIASLPISMASFSLSSHYQVGEAILAENVAMGTVLMLPTVLVWNIVMDQLGIFPIA